MRLNARSGHHHSVLRNAKRRTPPMPQPSCMIGVDAFVPGPCGRQTFVGLLSQERQQKPCQLPPWPRFSHHQAPYPLQFSLLIALGEQRHRVARDGSSAFDDRLTPAARTNADQTTHDRAGCAPKQRARPGLEVGGRYPCASGPAPGMRCRIRRTPLQPSADSRRHCPPTAAAPSQIVARTPTTATRNSERRTPTRRRASWGFDGFIAACLRSATRRRAHETACLHQAAADSGFL